MQTSRSVFCARIEFIRTQWPNIQRKRNKFNRNSSSSGMACIQCDYRLLLVHLILPKSAIKCGVVQPMRSLHSQGLLTAHICFQHFLNESKQNDWQAIATIPFDNGVCIVQFITYNKQNFMFLLLYEQSLVCIQNNIFSVHQNSSHWTYDF